MAYKTVVDAKAISWRVISNTEQLAAWSKVGMVTLLLFHLRIDPFLLYAHTILHTSIHTFNTITYSDFFPLLEKISVRLE